MCILSAATQGPPNMSEKIFFAVIFKKSNTDAKLLTLRSRLRDLYAPIFREIVKNFISTVVIIFQNKFYAGLFYMQESETYK